MTGAARRADDHPARVITRWAERPWGSPWTGRAEIVADASRIEQVRAGFPGGLGGPPMTYTVRRDGSASDAEFGARFDPAEFEVLALAIAYLDATLPAADVASDDGTSREGSQRTPRRGYDVGGPSSVSVVRVAGDAYRPRAAFKVAGLMYDFATGLVWQPADDAGQTAITT